MNVEIIETYDENDLMDCLMNVHVKYAAVEACSSEQEAALKEQLSVK